MKSFLERGKISILGGHGYAKNFLLAAVISFTTFLEIAFAPLFNLSLMGVLVLWFVTVFFFLCLVSWLYDETGWKRKAAIGIFIATEIIGFAFVIVVLIQNFWFPVI